MQKIFLLLFAVVFVFNGFALAQTPDALKNKILPGEVSSIDAARNQIIFKTSTGEMSIAFDAKTVFKKVSPDNPRDLKSALASSLSEIGVGDKIVAVGLVSADQKTVTAKDVYLMTKSDISKKQQTLTEQWQNGVAGRVTAVNPASKEFTVSTRGMGGEKAVVVTAKDTTIFRRYAVNSVKYADAGIGDFAQIKTGDQIRARGEKSVDGAALKADEILSGSFKMAVGKIEKIDAAKNEITIKDAQTDKLFVIAVNNSTLLRRFPAETAAQMAQMQAMRGAGGAGMGSGRPAMNGGQGSPNTVSPRPRPTGNEPLPNGAPQGGMMRGGGGDFDQMLEKMPVLSLTELKVGDAVAALNTNESAERGTAIKFVAGIEPFLNVPRPAQQGGGNRQQGSPQINIPGLDGFGTP